MPSSSAKFNNVVIKPGSNSYGKGLDPNLVVHGILIS